MGSSRVMGWLPLDDDCVRVILLFLRTGDVFAARASGLDCDSLLESDWEERLQEQPRPWAASVLFFWGGAWVAPFGRASFRRSVPRSSLGSRSLESRPSLVERRRRAVDAGARARRLGAALGAVLRGARRLLDAARRLRGASSFCGATSRPEDVAV